MTKLERAPLKTTRYGARQEAWLAALESGNYTRQATHINICASVEPIYGCKYMRVKGSSGKYSYDALGVACEVAVQGGGVPGMPMDAPRWGGDMPIEVIEYFAFRGSRGEQARWRVFWARLFVANSPFIERTGPFDDGWQIGGRAPVQELAKESFSIVQLNDWKGLSFEQIAAVVRAHPRRYFYKSV